jgi:hypothetical protein
MDNGRGEARRGDASGGGCVGGFLLEVTMLVVNGFRSALVASSAAGTLALQRHGTECGHCRLPSPVRTSFMAFFEGGFQFSRLSPKYLLDSLISDGALKVKNRAKISRLGVIRSFWQGHPARGYRRSRLRFLDEAAHGEACGSPHGG